MSATDTYLNPRLNIAEYIERSIHWRRNRLSPAPPISALSLTAWFGNVLSATAAFLRRIFNMVKRPGSAPAGQTVAVWENDPGSKDQPDGGLLLTVPAPDMAKTPYPLTTKTQAPPVKMYKAGTLEFRYWAGSAAVRRGAD